MKRPTSFQKQDDIAVEPSECRVYPHILPIISERVEKSVLGQMMANPRLISLPTHLGNDRPALVSEAENVAALNRKRFIVDRKHLHSPRPPHALPESVAIRRQDKMEQIRCHLHDCSEIIKVGPCDLDRLHRSGSRQVERNFNLASAFSPETRIPS